MNQQPTEKQIRDTYDLTKERYATIGVDADAAVARLAQIPISLHCWQGDDVAGFENPEGELSGGGSGCWSRSSASSGSQSYHEHNRLWLWYATTRRTALTTDCAPYADPSR